MIPIKTIAGLEVVEIQGEPHGFYIMLLHGFGADFYDLIPLSGIYKQSPRPTWIFPNGPLEIPVGPNWIGKAWFEIDIEKLQNALRREAYEEIDAAFPQKIEDARERIEILLDALEIPRSKLILGGFSQGAVLAMETALHSREPYGGLVLFSGTLIHKKKWEGLAHLQKNVPFFLSHGMNDTILPFSKAVELESLLTQNGLKGKLHAFEGGHEIPALLLKPFREFLETIIDGKK